MQQRCVDLRNMEKSKGGRREEISRILEDDRRKEGWLNRLQDRRELKEVERERIKTDGDGWTVDGNVRE